jgi:uncharacterized protein YecE (DUF72 family)
MIYIGTSGFSYKDWVGVFYPESLPQREWLSFYSREFRTCEINATYYTIPSLASIKSMVSKTGEGFIFAIKANQEMTHQHHNSTAICETFLKAMEPIINANKLGCILAQFPYSFDYNQNNLGYLALLRENLTGLPLVVEFRNARWLKVEVFQWLRQHDTGFCCVDEPRLPNLLPPIVEATNNIGYIRFHGRNKEKWWQHEQPYERYDYTYKTEELNEWMPKIQKLAGATENIFIFANNHWKGQSIQTIRQLRAMLD